MENEIQGELLKAKAEAREVRKSKGYRVGLIILSSIAFFVIGYDTPSVSGIFYFIDVTIIILGSLYILFNAVPAIYQPLPVEKRAFLHIFEAAETLRKSTLPIAYQEALKCLEKADSILDELLLADLKWYEKVNQDVNEFKSNLKYIVIPSTEKSKIKVEHLQEMAIALSEMSQARVVVVNQKIKTEPVYVSVQPLQQKPWLATLKESNYAKMGFSLALGYGLIVVISYIYAVATGQDFLNLARGHPEIIILGGLGLSGITFWRTKQ